MGPSFECLHFNHHYSYANCFSSKTECPSPAHSFQVSQATLATDGRGWKRAGPSDSNEQAPPGRAGERASIFSVRFFCCREEGKQARRLTPTLTHGVTDRPIIPPRKGNKRSLVMPSPPSCSYRPSVRPSAPVPPNHSPATHSPSTVRRGAGRHGGAAEEDRRRWTRGRRTLMQHYKVCKNGRLRCAACIPLPARPLALTMTLRCSPPDR